MNPPTYAYGSGLQGAAAPTTGSQPNFLDRLLPTAGGIIGGIGGTLVSPILGSAAGAAAGGAIGQKLENDLTGSKGSTLAAGAENGAGGLLGGVVGDAGKAILGKVVSPLADKGASSLLQGQFKGTLDNATAKTLSDMGITDARQVGQIAPLITSSDGALSTGVKTALGASADNGNGIDITGLDTIAKNHLAEQGASDKAINTVGSNLTKSINNMVNPDDITTAATKKGPSYAYTPGSLENALPEKVFGQSQKMDQLASQSYTKAFDKMGNVTNVDELTKAQTYSKLGDELESRAFGTNSNTPLPLTQDAKDAIISQLQPVKSINPTVYNKYVADVSSANNVQDLRPLQAPMVRGSRALQAAGNIGATKGLAMGDIARGTIGIAKSPVSAAAQLAVSSPTADRAGANLLSKVSGATAKDKALSSKIVPLATRAAAIGTANVPNLAASAPTSGTQTNNISSTIPATGTTGAPMNPLQQLYSEIIAQSQSPTGISGNLITTANSLAPQLQKQELAAPVVSSLESAFNNAGGAQGVGQGLLSKISGLIPGTAANTYNAQESAAASTIGQLLGISPQQAITMFPQLMQTQTTAAPQLNTLNSIAGNIGSPILSGVPGQ